MKGSMIENVKDFIVLPRIHRFFILLFISLVQILFKQGYYFNEYSINLIILLTKPMKLLCVYGIFLHL